MCADRASAEAMSVLDPGGGETPRWEQAPSVARGLAKAWCCHAADHVGRPTEEA